MGVAQLKDKVQGLTSHKKRLPEAQKNELILGKRPAMATTEENECVARPCTCRPRQRASERVVLMGFFCLSR